MQLPPQAPIPQPHLSPRPERHPSSWPDLNRSEEQVLALLEPPIESEEVAPGALRRFWGGWLRLVAPPVQGRDPASPAVRALQRRRSLASALLFGLLFLWTALVPINIALYGQDLMSVFLVITVGYLTLLAVGWLIRRGWVTGAAMILIALIFLGFIAIEFSVTGGVLERATAFYVLLYPILLAATLMPAESLFLTLVADFFLVAASTLIIWPPADRLASISAAQIANVYVWPLAALIIVTLVAYIWTSGMQRATALAELAQSDAVLTRVTEANAHRALEHDVRELIRVVDAWTSGNLGAQFGPLASPDLRRVAMALSGYAGRARSLARDEYDFQRERDTIRRIAETIIYYRQGLPATWPAYSGLPADLITRAVTTSDPAALLADLNGERS